MLQVWIWRDSFCLIEFPFTTSFIKDWFFSYLRRKLSYSTVNQMQSQLPLTLKCPLRSNVWSWLLYYLCTECFVVCELNTDNCAVLFTVMCLMYHELYVEESNFICWSHSNKVISWLSEKYSAVLIWVDGLHKWSPWVIHYECNFCGVIYLFLVQSFEAYCNGGHVGNTEFNLALLIKDEVKRQVCMLFFFQSCEKTQPPLCADRQFSHSDWQVFEHDCKNIHLL